VVSDFVEGLCWINTQAAQIKVSRMDQALYRCGICQGHRKALGVIFSDKSIYTSLL